MSKEIEIPNYKPSYGMLEEYKKRDEYITKYGYIHVNWKWVNPLADWIGSRRCLEVMLGLGLLTYALQQKGVKIIATDDYSWFNKGNREWDDTYTVVKKIDAIKAIEKYGDQIDILILSWPDFRNDISYKVLKKLHEINPNAQMIYIGERYGGCTGCDKFHDHLKFIEDKEFKKIQDKYEAWHGIYDKPFLVQYKE
jgi:hypothetical protein